MKFLFKQLIIVMTFYSFNLVAAEIEINGVDIPIAKNMQIQVVADELSFNTLQMGIVQFKTNNSPSSIVKFYKRAKEIKIAEFDYWEVISWLDDEQLVTVQITYDEMQNLTHGFIGVSDLPTKIKSNKSRSVNIGKGFPSLSNSEFINDIKATDLNKISRTIWLSNNRSVLDNLKFYQRHYKSKGWSLDYIDNNPKKSGGLLMRKGADELNLTAQIDLSTGKTQVITVLVEK